MLHGKLPFSGMLLPISTNDTSIQLHIAIKVPLLGSFRDVLVDCRATRVETRPIRVRVKWKGLNWLENTKITNY